MEDKQEAARGSGNMFRDLEHENADAEQFKALLADEIIRTLDKERLSAPASLRLTSRASEMRISGGSHLTG